VVEVGGVVVDVGGVVVETQLGPVQPGGVVVEVQLGPVHPLGGGVMMGGGVTVGGVITTGGVVTTGGVITGTGNDGVVTCTVQHGLGPCESTSAGATGLTVIGAMVGPPEVAPVLQHG
jgi:hypothetical protein